MSTEKGEKLKDEGNAFFKKEDYASAIAKFNEALQEKPGDDKLLSNRSVCYSMLKQYSEALVDAEEVIKINPSWFRGYARMATALAGLDRKEEAAKARQAEGNLCSKDKNYKQALQAYDLGLALHQNDVLWNNRAATLMNLERYEEGVKSARKSIKINPEFVKAYVRAGRGLLKLLDVSAARQILEEGKEKGLPKDDKTLEEEYKLVLQVQNKALKLKPLFGDSHTHIAFGMHQSQPAVNLAVNSRILLYFSAHWCPPCKQFTPILANLYNSVLKHRDVEVVFVSADKGAAEMGRYVAESMMPWRAFPWGDPAIAKLNQHFQIQGIPALIVLDSDGTVISKDGRNDVMQHGANIMQAWKR